ncbi:MAG: methyltransferase family protein [Pseudomonadota bacterium]
MTEYKAVQPVDSLSENRPGQGRGASRVATGSIWLMYTLIVLEILFMVSPFGLYYYSAYSIPLNALAANPSKGWLVQHILPHFAYHTSTLAHILIGISWPLMLIGLGIFLVGFAQIYWAKFTGKGAVAVGLYRYVRHPQYVALGIVGLGATLYWSRFLVVIAYITMLYLYGWLARFEETRCLQKFGEPYANYLRHTSRFFPGIGTGSTPAAGSLTRSIVWVVAWVLTLAVSVSIGFLLKQHVIDAMARVEGSNSVLVALAPVDNLSHYNSLLVSDPMIREAMAGLDGPNITYLAPMTWSIPELGLSPVPGYETNARDELRHPTQHGNSLDFDPSHMRLLVTKAEGVRAGDDILMEALAVTPLLEITVIDGVVNAIDDKPHESYWDGIPVPVY